MYVHHRMLLCKVQNCLWQFCLSITLMYCVYHADVLCLSRWCIVSKWLNVLSIAQSSSIVLVFLLYRMCWGQPQKCMSKKFVIFHWIAQEQREIEQYLDIMCDLLTLPMTLTDLRFISAGSTYLNSLYKMQNNYMLSRSEFKVTVK